MPKPLPSLMVAYYKKPCASLDQVGRLRSVYRGSWSHCALAAGVQVTANVQEGLRPSIPKPEDLPGAEKVFAGLDRYIALLNRCWSQKPADRPPLAAIVSELW